MYIDFEEELQIDGSPALLYRPGPLQSISVQYTNGFNAQSYIDFGPPKLTIFNIDLKTSSAEPKSILMETDLPADSSTPVTIGTGENHASDLSDVTDVD